MAIKSPTDISDNTIRYTIKVAGSPIKDYYPVLSISVTNELNKIASAEIELIDGSIEKSKFDISDSEDLIPGNEVEITVGYGDDAEVSIFKGVIVKQGIRMDQYRSSLFILCKHKAVEMTFRKMETQFSKKADSAIISDVITTYGITKTVTATTIVQEVVFQKMASDWDFILARAQFNGFVINCDGDKLLINKPKMDGTAVLRIALGDSIISFNGDLDAESQPTSVQTSGWDIKTLALINSTAAEPTLNSQGNLNAKKLSAKLNQKDLKLTSNTPLTKEELKAWADSNLLNLRLAALKGEVSFIGNSSVKPDTIITLEGVGERFNGSAYVSSVNHSIKDGAWITTVKFGLEKNYVSEKLDFSYVEAGGQLPAIRGLQVGTVKKISGDPDSQFRILVTLPSNATNQDGIWARMANFYATSAAGSGFLPEVGDEVVVGFLESDPRYPIILGSLYSSSKAPSLTPSDENNYIKSIITKSKLKISFDDEKKITKIETPGGNSIKLDDDAKSIEIIDQNNNTIKMTSGGIDITSAKDINLKATGNITLDATGKLNLSSKQDVAIAGLNIKNAAQVGFEAKGNATAEISASGQTTVKGAMVMIN